jgi:3'-phosphoadenosine 5'-phosphosulfate sulfotransferase
MLPPARLDALVDDLESGRARPRLIVLDDDLRRLGPRFLAFVQRNYTSSDAVLYFRTGASN